MKVNGTVVIAYLKPKYIHVIISFSIMPIDKRASKFMLRIIGTSDFKVNQSPLSSKNI